MDLTLEYKLDLTKFNGDFDSVIIESFPPCSDFILNENETIENSIPSLFLFDEYQKLIYRNGHLKRKETKKYNFNSTSIITYDYNHFNKLIKLEEEGLRIKTFKYNYHNKLTHKEQEGWKPYFNKYFYSEKGELIKVEWRSDLYALIDWNLRFDEKGNMVEKTGTYLHGQISTFYEESNKFDEENRIVESNIEQYIDGRGTQILKKRINYNKSSLIKNVSKEFNFWKHDEIEKSEEIFKYDKVGNILFYESYYKGSYSDELNKWESLSWQYAYDENLNWQKGVQLKNNKPEVFFRRTFI